MLHVVITGAAGFVGSNLSRRLLLEGHAVTGLDDFSYGNPGNLESLRTGSRFTFLERDITAAGALDRVGGDVLVHLASHKIPRYGNAHVTLQQNSRMTGAVIAKCREDSCKLVFASTSDVYGKNPAVPYGEESDSVLGPVTVPRWSYAVSKLHSEHAIRAAGLDAGFPCAIARLFGSYGPHHHLSWWGGPQSEFISRSLKKEKLPVHGDGNQTRSFIYIDDLVDGLVRIIESERSDNEIFNLSSDPGTEIAIADLARMVWKLVNGDGEAPLEFVPYETFGRYEDVPRRTGDASKARKLLGFDPKTGLEEGLKRTIAWQRGVMGL